MAFGINRAELKQWKAKVRNGQIAFLTHYWLDDRFPGCNTVTKVGCNDVERLKAWEGNMDLEKNGLTIKLAIRIMTFLENNSGKY